MSQKKKKKRAGLQSFYGSPADLYKQSINGMEQAIKEVESEFPTEFAEGLAEMKMVRDTCRTLEAGGLKMHAFILMTTYIAYADDVDTSFIQIVDRIMAVKSTHMIMRQCIRDNPAFRPENN